MEINKDFILTVKDIDNTTVGTSNRETVLQIGDVDESSKIKTYIADVTDNSVIISRKIKDVEIDTVEFIFDEAIDLGAMRENIGLEVKISL